MCVCVIEIWWRLIRHIDDVSNWFLHRILVVRASVFEDEPGRAAQAAGGAAGRPRDAHHHAARSPQKSSKTGDLVGRAVLELGGWRTLPRPPPLLPSCPNSPSSTLLFRSI